MSPSSKFYALIIGVAPGGTGHAAALRFSQTYPVVLLSRSDPSRNQSIVDAITASGGKALALAADASDPAAVDAALKSVGETWGELSLAAVVFNADAGFARKPFLELQSQDLDRSLGTSVHGLFNVAQRTLPHLLAAVPSAPHPPSLIVTGATASLRGSANFSTFAAGKFAQRALVQSLAREFGKQGVHVSLAVIDGGINVPRLNDIPFNGGADDGKLSTDAIAESYWHLHTQHRSAWTLELDLRPYVEKF